MIYKSEEEKKYAIIFCNATVAKKFIDLDPEISNNLFVTQILDNDTIIVKGRDNVLDFLLDDDADIYVSKTSQYADSDDEEDDDEEVEEENNHEDNFSEPEYDRYHSRSVARRCYVQHRRFE